MCDGLEDLGQVCRVGDSVRKHAQQTASPCCAHESSGCKASAVQSRKRTRRPCVLFDLPLHSALGSKFSRHGSSTLSLANESSRASTVPALPRGGCILGGQGLRLSGSTSFDMNSSDLEKANITMLCFLCFTYQLAQPRLDRSRSSASTMHDSRSAAHTDVTAAEPK